MVLFHLYSEFFRSNNLEEFFWQNILSVRKFSGIMVGSKHITYESSANCRAIINKHCWVFYILLYPLDWIGLDFFFSFDSFYHEILLINLAGVKAQETNEVNELILEPAIRWAGNPNIILVLKLLSLRITLQVRRAFNLRSSSVD